MLNPTISTAPGMLTNCDRRHRLNNVPRAGNIEAESWRTKKGKVLPVEGVVWAMELGCGEEDGEWLSGKLGQVLFSQKSQRELSIYCPFPCYYYYDCDYHYHSQVMYSYTLVHTEESNSVFWVRSSMAQWLWCGLWSQSSWVRISALPLR